MVKSMTGFGRGEATGAGFAVTVELSTVNRKQFDATLWLPKEWLSFEARLQGLFRTGIVRGALKCSVNVRPLSDADAAAALETRFRTVCDTAKRLGLKGEPTVSDLAALAAAETETPPPEPTDAVWETVAKAAQAALDKVCEMREAEGGRIATDLHKRLQGLRDLHAQIAALAPTLPPLWRDTLRKRIAELLPDGAALDAATLEREVALFADRCDISEELTRLASHFTHADRLLEGKEPCGRPLDFLCQELNREANTIGSKCAGSEIPRLVIAFKTLLETFREQVQNLE